MSPRDASDRLGTFQAQFDELWRRYQTYTDGESLFGLPVTDYEELNRIRKELNLLQKLYGLYNTVIDSVDGYYDILWAEVINFIYHPFMHPSISYITPFIHLSGQQSFIYFIYLSIFPFFHIIPSIYLSDNVSIMYSSFHPLIIYSLV